MGFFFTKLLLLGVVALVFIKSSPPYFPIEVSRCIASNHVATSIFVYGSIAVACFAMVIGSEHVLTAVALLFIGYYDDVQHWAMHMVGVGLLGIAAASLAYQQQNIAIIASVVVLYGARLVVKFVAVVVYEGVSPWDLSAVASAGFNIMYTGKCLAWQTLFAFKLCGVMQWIVFVIIAQLY